MDTTFTVNTPGYSTFIIPNNVRQIRADAVGAGCNGIGTSGGGGGGFSRSVITVTPGQTLYFRLGGGNSATGIDSWVNTSNVAPTSSSTGCLASAAQGRYGGGSASTTIPVGSLTAIGGNGGPNASYFGGGGGGAAGPTGAGSNGSFSNSNYGGWGGAGDNSLAAGGQGSFSTATPAGPGGSYVDGIITIGGGGGGGGSGGIGLPPTPAASGGLYGGGGGGSISSVGIGRQGLIVLRVTRFDQTSLASAITIANRQNIINKFVFTSMSSTATMFGSRFHLIVAIAAGFAFASTSKSVNLIRNAMSTTTSTWSKIVTVLRPWILSISSPKDSTVMGTLYAGNVITTGNAVTSFAGNVMTINGTSAQIQSAVSQLAYTSPSGLDDDWVANYSLLNQNNSLTSVQTQHNKSSSNQYMSYALPTFMTMNYASVLVNCPQITEVTSNVALTNFTCNVATIPSTGVASALSADVTAGGTATYASNVLSLVGTKDQVNAMLTKITYTPVANYNSEFDFSYKYTSPDASMKSTRIQHIYPNNCGTFVNYSLCYTRNYRLNITNQQLFATYPPLVIDTTATSTDRYTILLTTMCGAWTDPTATESPTSLYTVSGSKDAINALIPTILFNPSTNVFGNQTAKMQVFKNNALVVSQTFGLFGA